MTQNAQRGSEKELGTWNRDPQQDQKSSVLTSMEIVVLTSRTTPPMSCPPPTTAPQALTGAFLDAAALPERVPAQLAVEILLPELGKPDVPAVVVQGPAGEVAVETCRGRKQMEGINPEDASLIRKFPRKRGRELL